MHRKDIQTLNQTPRPITPALERFALQFHPRSRFGYILLLIGISIAFGCGFTLLAMFFEGFAPDSLLWRILVFATGLGIFIGFAGFVLKVATKTARPEDLETVANMKLSVAAIVQANHILYTQNAKEAPAVIVFATSDDRRLDADWVRYIADQLYTIKENRTGKPKLDKLGALLRNEQSRFDKRLPKELVGDVRAHWKTIKINPKYLPQGHINEDEVIPLLIHPKHGATIAPPNLYSQNPCSFPVGNSIPIPDRASL